MTSRGLRDPQAVSRALLQNIAASETMDAVTTPVPVAAPALQALLLRALARARALEQGEDLLGFPLHPPSLSLRSRP